MRIERWYWLFACCMVSLGIHVALAYHSGRLPQPPLTHKVTEIEVALLPQEVAPPAVAAPKPQPKPRQEIAQKPSPASVAHDRQVMRHVMTASNTVAPVSPTAIQPKVETTEKRPTAPKAEVGGIDPNRLERPTTVGLPSGAPNAAPQLQRVARLDPVPGGGGSPAPGIVLGGKGGAPGPEAPPEDIVFNGGGAGGEKLPKAAPRIGGGGGRSILSVENPLASESASEKPGLGPGGGGGQGQGQGGGLGVGRQFGIGTRIDGVAPLATLHSKPGNGIGAGQGSGVGTRPPGGGHGTGSELPGTGGTGLGYGRGSGVGVGNGSGTGVGDGAGSRGGLSRGIPFGDIAGLLKGDPNGGGGQGGGPGGPGRGAVFGQSPGGGGGGPVHIVYMLDVSGSMAEGNKIGKAKAALKKAVNELKPQDSFGIIQFAGYVRFFNDVMVPASKENIEAACEYVDLIQLKPATNFQDSLRVAFEFEGVTHLFVLSDGEPTVRETNPLRLRAMVRELNATKHVRIITMALGLGEHFPGMEFLQGLAEENGGTFSYINLANQPQPLRSRRLP